MAVLRAIPENGPPVDDPSEYRLFLMFEDLEAGKGEFLIIERPDDTSGETYAQTVRHDDGTYTVEHREGSAERHFGTFVSDMREAHRLLTDWAYQRQGWDLGYEWERVDL
jgi:hypothetical protein